MKTNFNQQAQNMTGMERLKAYEQQGERHGMAENLGYTMGNCELGNVTLHYTPKERHMNLIGSLHGGILASLLDTAMGCAVMTYLEVSEKHTMTDLNTKFIRAVMNADEQLTIVGRVEHPGRRLIATEGTIHNQDGKLIARSIASAIRL